MARSPYYYGGGQASAAYVPPQMPGFTAPASTIPNYFPYGGQPGPEEAAQQNWSPDTPPPGWVENGTYNQQTGPQTVAPVAQALAQQPFNYETDPGYLASLAAEQAGSQQLDNALRAAQEQSIVRFGDPSLAQSLGIGVNPATAAAAQQNTQAGNSTLARLQHSRDLGQQTIQNQLAAHGLQFSGDLGYKTGENQRGYGNQLYDAQQAVLDALNKASGDVASQKQGLHSSVISAMQNAYSQYVANPNFWQYPDTGGSTAAASTAATTPVAPTPVAQAIPQMPGFTAKAPTSRLASSPRPAPYSFRSTGRYA